MADYSSTSIDTAVIRGGWPKPHYGDAGEVIHRLCDALDEARVALRATVQLCDMHSLTVPVDARRLANLKSTRPQGEPE